MKNLKDKYNINDAASLSDVEKRLVKVYKDEDMLITYNTIWNSKQTDNIIALYCSSSDIYAKYDRNSIKIATYNFVNKDKNLFYPEKIRTCWYVSDYSDIKCKSIKTEKDPDYDDKVEFTVDYPFMLNENIVVGDYISRSEAILLMH